ncbi:MAG: GNAT family N-acetyltransferase, partial [Phycisphaerae bacterium]|nr:GNAT family N-acetyltransferase [Phycisphaerae bacterium]
MQTRIIDEADIDLQLDQSIRDLLVVAFPHASQTFAAARRWRGSVPLFSVVIHDHDVLCAHLAVVDRTIRAADQTLRVAGVALVAVAPACRGRRLIDGALAAAMHEAAARTFDCGFLFTHRPTNQIYARNGWLE